MGRATSLPCFGARVLRGARLVDIHPAAHVYEYPCDTLVNWRSMSNDANVWLSMNSFELNIIDVIHMFVKQGAAGGSIEEEARSERLQLDD